MTQGAFIMSWKERERGGTRPVGLLSTHCHLQLHCPSHPLQLAIAIVKLVKKNLTASKRIWQEESCAVPSVLCCAFCAVICVVFCELLEEFDITIPHHCQEEFVYTIDFIRNHLTSSEIIWHQKSFCQLSFTRKLANWVDIMATKGCPHSPYWVNCVDKMHQEL